uniref:Methyltransferase domain-containing protein n=1 Tax=Gouania willdenowi TaxID=441366 RepID=A0A8C5DIS2_GOUWI
VMCSRFLVPVKSRAAAFWTNSDLIENMDKKSHVGSIYTETISKNPNFKNFEWFFVLDMGCGTSALGPSIYRHSPLAISVTCADISPVAVRLMQEEIHANPRIPPLKKHFRPSSVDVILDKGTMDALLRSKEGRGKAGLLLSQCLKVLRCSGSLLQFSDEDPDASILWLETAAQHVEIVGVDVGVQEEVEKLRGVTYYCYQVTPCLIG